MQESYNHNDIEKKQQTKWENLSSFVVNEKSNKPKFYCLSMFAYPSGKLHMGHVRNYTIGDVISRFYIMKGYNVLQPFGWDAFGLPAENAAIQNGIAPAKWTYENIEYMRYQLKSIGLAVDWSREFATCSPTYYKHQQWLFIKLYEKGLIFRKKGLVNWDPVDQTVLANEQVIDGKGWRSGAIVEKKEIPMYYFKITAYAEELLKDLDNLSGWPEQVKIMQKNWIGKSSGMEICFPYKENETKDSLKVYTTRADTLMGVTFIAISPEHKLATLALEKNPQLKDFIIKCSQGGVSEIELAKKEKKGIFSGLYVLHPVTREQIPIWIANYVLTNYGEGAVMGVPAHCQRDFEFAHKYNLPIKIVLKPKENLDLPIKNAICEETNEGILINSGQFNGLNFNEAFSQIEKFLQDNNLGQARLNYRLRDWGISRQRYWGCPIPIINCKNCGDIPVPENHLPVILPENVIPDGIGSPLSKMADFYETTCPKCGGYAYRETDTMDTFVDSSWYYARYPSFNCKDAILDDRVNYWTPVNQYIGGIEHAILHLLYARFIHKCLRDLGFVKSSEPFSNLLTQGMVLAETFYRQNKNGKKEWYNPSDIKITKNEKGQITSAIYKVDNKEVEIGGMEKMSKSKNNGVDPQALIKNYGADTARLFTMFAAPAEASLEWSDHGVEGANRFIRRLWRFVFEHVQKGVVSKYKIGELTNEQKKLRRQLHQTIEKVTYDIEIRKQFNTAIASIMELINSYSKVSFIEETSRQFAQELLEAVIIMLSPIIPHVCEELWQQLRPNTELLQQKWVEVDKNAIEANEIEIIIQVNGKLRGKIMVDKSLSKEQLEVIALENSNVQKFIANLIIKKIIIVPNKLINIVV